MIQLKVRRTNSYYGTWACEEIGHEFLFDTIGIGTSIESAIEDFLRSFKVMKGYEPHYNWGIITDDKFSLYMKRYNFLVNDKIISSLAYSITEAEQIAKVISPRIFSITKV